jgi:predicted porin
MKKSLLALAVLGAFAGAASAQSSVTVYGKLDLAFAKNIGTENKSIDDNTGSRLGFRGVEDLGGGMKALFGFEHRFNPDTGTSANSNFWNGYSTVGLATPYGTVNLGRQYVAAWLIQNQIDPFGADTVAALRDIGVRPSTTNSGTGRVGVTRVADSVRYDIAMSGFAFAVSYAESTAPANDAPVSVGLTYTAGPIFVGVGYENPTDPDDELTTIGGAYTFSFAKIAASYSSGKNTSGASVKSYLVGATVPFGALDIQVGYAQATTEIGGVDQDLKKVGIGAHYKLSKRTKVFADYAKVGGDLALGPKMGYDLGIQHNF